jgi:hypothetical protein
MTAFLSAQQITERIHGLRQTSRVCQVDCCH